MEKGDIPENANEHCPGPQSETAGKTESCAGCPNQETCSTAPKGPDPDLVAIAERMSTVKHKILVMSGKGGVGKSTFSAQLSFALASMDHQVGLMDTDICDRGHNSENEDENCLSVANPLRQAEGIKNGIVMDRSNGTGPTIEPSLPQLKSPSKTKPAKDKSKKDKIQKQSTSHQMMPSNRFAALTSTAEDQ